MHTGCAVAVLALGCLIALPAASADPQPIPPAPAKTNATTAETQTGTSAADTPPGLLLAPLVAIEFGRTSILTTEVGGSVVGRVSGGFYLGATFATTIGVLQGMEGCTTVDVCLHSRTRYAARMEYHGYPGASFDPWFGLDLGMDHMNATRAGATDDRDMPPTVPVIIPSGGFDVTARTEGVSVGAGLFVGTPLGYGIGLQVGARLVVGMF